jgi:O-antigen/teichoic acid export membrane protein
MRHGRSPGPSLRSYLLRGSAWMLLLRVAAMGLGLAVSALLARGLGSAGFGLYSLVLSLVTILALPLIGGLPTLLVREIAAARAEGRPEVVLGVVRWGYRLVAAAALALALAAAAVHAVAVAAGFWPMRPDQLGLAVLAVICVPLLGLMHLQSGILTGHQRAVLGLLGEQLLRPLALCLVLLVAAGPLLGLGPAGALGLYVGATLAVAAVMAVVIANLLPERGGTVPEIRHREWVLALLPLTMISATAIIKNNTDILVLGALQPVEDVGIYRIGAQIAALAAFMMQIMRSLTAPTIAAAHARQDRKALHTQLVLAARASLAGALAVVLGLALFGRALLGLVFGAEYEGAYGPCLALSLGTLVSAGCGLGNIALQVTRHSDIVARAAVIAAVTNLVFNVLLVPFYGALGAAIGTALAMTIMQVQLWASARRVLGLRTDAFQRVRT